MSGTSKWLMGSSLLLLWLNGCGKQREAVLFADTGGCLLSMSAKAAVLGQPITFKVRPKETPEPATFSPGPGPTAIAWSMPKIEWIPDNKPGEKQFSPDFQIVTIADMQAVAQVGYQAFRMVYNLKDSISNSEAREFFKAPGTVRQTFELLGPAGCTANVDIPLNVAQEYQDNYWRSHP